MEFNERLQIFTENKRRVDKHNEGNHSFTSTSNFSMHVLIQQEWNIFSVFRFFLQWGWTSFQTWHLMNSESRSSGLCRRWCHILEGGEGGGKLFCFFFVTFYGFNFICCYFQNCSATKGNYVQSQGPHPDSIDWRNKGNYVTPVKNQVRFKLYKLVPDS